MVKHMTFEKEQTLTTIPRCELQKAKALLIIGESASRMAKKLLKNFDDAELEHIQRHVKNIRGCADEVLAVLKPLTIDLDPEIAKEDVEPHPEIFLDDRPLVMDLDPATVTAGRITINPNGTEPKEED